MRLVFSVITIFLYCINVNAQTTWEERRDWVVGHYEGFYVKGDTATGKWCPMEFNIVYNQTDSNTVKIKDFMITSCNNSEEGFPYAWSYFYVSEDSLLGQYYAQNDTFYYSEFKNSYSKSGGRLLKDSIYEHWCYCPSAICSVEDWEFFRGKKVSSSVNSQPLSSKDKEMNIYPNPAKDMVFIDTNEEILEYKVYNSIGKLLIHEKEPNVLQFSIHEFNAGLYFIEVNGKDFIKTEKFVVK